MNARSALLRLSILSLVALVSLVSIAACGGAVDPNASTDGGTGDASSSSPTPGTTGAPCVTQQESDPMFNGFDEQQVSVETSHGAPSGAPVCLVHHFRGRPTCPYGQDSNGQPPQGAAACTAGKGGPPVVGVAQSRNGAAVQAQCVDRLAASTVIQSCRCANDFGKTDDGDNYCTCPSGMACAPLITSIGASTDHLAGSYCIHAGTAFDPITACSMVCDPVAHPCP